MPNKQTIASNKWLKNAGLMIYAIKLKRELVEQFRAVVKSSGKTQTDIITDFMTDFIKKNK